MDITSSSNPSTYGKAVVFTATVTSAGGTPTGTVQFMDGSTVLKTVVLSGYPSAAIFVSSKLLVGNHLIKAVYWGMPISHLLRLKF